ncbi:MAG: hypothetical protein QXG03_06155, partial [Halalkalicoccus sp.]
FNTMSRNGSPSIAPGVRLDRRLLAVNAALLGGGVAVALALSLAATLPMQVALAVVGTVLFAGTVWLGFERLIDRASRGGDPRAATAVPDGGEAGRER